MIDKEVLTIYTLTQNKRRIATGFVDVLLSFLRRRVPGSRHLYLYNEVLDNRFGNTIL